MDNQLIDIRDCECTAKITFNQINQGTYQFIFLFSNNSKSKVTISPSDFNMVAFLEEKASQEIIPIINPEDKIIEVDILVDKEESRYRSYEAGQSTACLLDFIFFFDDKDNESFMDSSEEQEAEKKKA